MSYTLTTLLRNAVSAAEKTIDDAQHLSLDDDDDRAQLRGLVARSIAHQMLAWAEGLKEDAIRFNSVSDVLNAADVEALALIIIEET